MNKPEGGIPSRHFAGSILPPELTGYNRKDVSDERWIDHEMAG